MSSFYAIAITLFFAIDALGIIPDYLQLVEKFPPRQKFLIAVQELLIALVIMILFHFLGAPLLNLLSLTKTVTQIAGGIVIFLIALRLIFPKEDEIVRPRWKNGRPFIVPIATPLMAGPSVLAMIMIYSQESNRSNLIIGAIFAAWLLSAIVFLAANPLYKLFREKGLNAIQRLMGLIVAIVAVQMFLQGIKGIVAR